MAISHREAGVEIGRGGAVAAPRDSVGQPARVAGLVDPGADSTPITALDH